MACRWRAGPPEREPRPPREPPGSSRSTTAGSSRAACCRLPDPPLGFSHIAKIGTTFILRLHAGRWAFNCPGYRGDVRVAVLDLGSTSFRLVDADWVPGNGLVPHVQRRERLNLGLVLGREGRIPEPHASAAAKAVAELRRRAEAGGAGRVVGGAPSALRDARHRGKGARRLQAAAGTPARVPS